MRTLRRWWKRVRVLAGGGRDDRRLHEEFEQHIAMATEDNIRSGMPADEARRRAVLSFGAVEAMKESYRDQRSLPWLESLRSDAVFGWRQLKKHRTTSAAAILSLALATGACTSAFRLMDALLWRPLPVAKPAELFALSRVGTGFNGKPNEFDGWAYPSFQRMRAAVKGQAELIAISYAERTDITYRSDQEMEKATVQYVSGWMFGSFGLSPSLGRLLSEDDDRKPGAHPYAVISHDYWQHRFGSDVGIVGRSLRMGDAVFEIVGVGPEGFGGTEPGVSVDIFVPTMMRAAVVREDSTWHRTIARINPKFAAEPIRQKLQATSAAFERERAKKFSDIERRLKRFDEAVVLTPAAAGISGLQKDYRRALTILGVLVVLVLLIACANVANLMTARAAARSREMALRVSIGAGRWRLVQMVLVESAILACLSAAAGALFAWWSAPFVIGQISPPDHPVRLALPADWRVLGFGALLTLSVMLLFGLMPALRASGVKPASALKGGEDPHAKRRTMHALIAGQVAFCFLILFIAGLFATTFERLSKRPLGFSADRLVNLVTVAKRAQPPVYWQQVLENLRAVPGVEAAGLARWSLIGGVAMNGFISVNGAPPGPVIAFFLNVSPGWIDTLGLRLMEGRDFRAGETTPGFAIVNETFAKQYFGEGSPLGKRFSRGQGNYVVVGLVKDAPYRSLREPILPVAYTPFDSVGADGAPQPIRENTFVVRTASTNPLSMASILRSTVARTRPDFLISNIQTQKELVEMQTLRERLLAMLAMFFAGVAVLLAGIGLYGILDYSVLQRRKEIGIRMAIGAQGGGIARLVTKDAFLMVLAGALAGLALGWVSGQFLDTLLYGVKSTELRMFAIPLAAILGSALAAALAPVLRAIGIDPIAMLRSE